MTCDDAGVTAATMAVRPGPASAGCKMRVSFESRYGTCPTEAGSFFSARDGTLVLSPKSPEPDVPADVPAAYAFASLCTQRRSVSRLWLMFEPSFLSCVCFLVRAALGSARSEPARSTTYRVELSGGPVRACPGLGLDVTEMRSTAWLRLELAFIAVRPTLRLRVPSSTKSMICREPVTKRSSSPMTRVKPLGPFTSLTRVPVVLVLHEVSPFPPPPAVVNDARGVASGPASGASKSRISSL